jgi:glycosyltransferase involved in cell wall biosynthesis
MTYNTTPCVSIIIPTYNRATLLRETLESIIFQTFSSWEAIVVDDNSTDTTQDVVNELIQRSFPIRYVKNLSGVKGPSSCRNYGFKIAQGSYIIFLDSDDLLAPHCLEKRVEVMVSNPSFDFVVFQCHKFKESQFESNKELWNRWNDTDDLDSFLDQQVLWQTAGPIWRRDSLNKVGGWDQTILFGEDFEYHIRALANDLIYQKINEVDYFWRLPRTDSFSGFEAKKLSFANGAVSHCFLIILSVLMQTKKVTKPRSYLLEKDARNIGIKTLLYGGKRMVALKAFMKLYEYGLISSLSYFEYFLIFTLWGKFYGRIPALSYLNWRFPFTSDT